jgi:hypothetical protein
LTYTEKDVKKFFPEGLPKHLITEEFATTKINAVLLRPQTLKILNDLNLSQEKHFVKHDSPLPNILCIPLHLG